MFQFHYRHHWKCCGNHKVLRWDVSAFSEESPSILKKIGRCSEMVFRSANKLLTTSNYRSQNSSNVTSDTPRSVASTSAAQDMRSTDELEFSSLLNDTQLEHIDRSAEDVKLATQALSAVIRKRLPSNDSFSGSKMKRMLPPTPGGSTSGRPPMLRCKSAKTPDNIRRSKSYYDVNSKTSNEIWTLWRILEQVLLTVSTHNSWKYRRIILWYFYYSQYFTMYATMLPLLST